MSGGLFSKSKSCCDLSYKTTIMNHFEPPSCQRSLVPFYKRSYVHHSFQPLIPICHALNPPKHNAVIIDTTVWERGV